HATATLALQPGTAGPDTTAVAAALASVPSPAMPSERAALTIMPDPGAAKPTWTLAWRGGDAPEDIFADAPDGYYFATR
ncbi:hypothetical protein ACSTIM_23390, partial [Vibrio parahaemolyticus]